MYISDEAKKGIEAYGKLNNVSHYDEVVQYEGHEIEVVGTTGTYAVYVDNKELKGNFSTPQQALAAGKKEVDRIK